MPQRRRHLQPWLSLLLLLPAGDGSRCAQEEPGSRIPIEVETVAGVEHLVLRSFEETRLEKPAPSDADPATWRIHFAGRSFPLGDLVFLSSGPNRRDRDVSDILFLRGGGELAGAVASGNGDSVKWLAASLGSDPIPVALERVRGVLVRPGAKAARAPAGKDAVLRRNALRQSLRREILTTRPARDSVVLQRGTRLEGILDALEKDDIRFNSDSLGDVRLPYTDVRAVLLAPLEPGAAKPARRPVSPSTVRISLRDGSEIACRLREISGGLVTVEHADLGSRKIALDEIARVAFLGGKVRFLSDLDPVKVEERLGILTRLKMPYQRDASVMGTPIRLARRTYRKGLGVHSYSRLEYELGAKFGRLRATIGLDDTARPPGGAPGLERDGAVVFRVKLDGKLLAEKPMTWRDGPARIDVSVAGGKRLALEVDYGGDSAAPLGRLALGRADWADARLIR